MSRWRGVWLAAALLLGLKGVFALIPGMWAWGLNVQRFLDPVSGWGLWACAALLLLPPLARPLVPALEGLGTFLAHSPRAFWSAGIAGALFVFVLPDQVWFTGDFFMRQVSIPSDLSAGYQYALPLDRFLHREFPRLFGSAGLLGASLGLRLLGAVEAGLLAVLSVTLARALSTRAAAVTVSAAVVFFGGSLTLYTGLGKPAGELCLAVVGVAAFGLRAVGGASSLLPAGLCVAVALALHRAGLLLLPTFALIAWLRFRRPAIGPGDRALSVLAVLIPPAVGLSVAPGMARGILDWDLPRHLLSPVSRGPMELFAASFAPRHLLDLLNLLLALTPLCLALLLGRVPSRSRSERTPETLVLGLLALSFIPVLLFIHPSQGVFRDWDVFAPAGIALSVLVAHAVASEARDEATAAVGIVAVVCVTSLQWLVLNHDSERGLQRVEAYLLEAPEPADDIKSVVWDFVAVRRASRAQWGEAAEASRRAAAAAPHRRLLLTWAIHATMAGDLPGSAAAYRQILARDSTDLIAWVGLAGVSRRSGDAPELARALEVIRGRPHDPARLAELRRFVEHFPVIWPLDSLGASAPPEEGRTHGRQAGQRVARGLPGAQR